MSYAIAIYSRYTFDTIQFERLHFPTASHNKLRKYTPLQHCHSGKQGKCWNDVTEMITWKARCHCLGSTEKHNKLYININNANKHDNKMKPLRCISSAYI